MRAIGELGVRNLRRLQYHDPNAPGWRVIGRLLRTLETVNAGLDSPVTAHRRRAMADAVAVLLVWRREGADLLGLDRGGMGPSARQGSGRVPPERTRLGRRRGPPLPRRARLPAGLLH
ncbi:hypothetical protein Rwratislav_11758 [Rhodococcus wratislaviensis IFP 2016]|nr:hypothetical protein Rwratislav_11758 [Rhodococcus wratislaviensis IFP 2016]